VRCADLFETALPSSKQGYLCASFSFSFQGAFEQNFLDEFRDRCMPSVLAAGYRNASGRDGLDLDGLYDAREFARSALSRTSDLDWAACLDFLEGRSHVASVSGDLRRFIYAINVLCSLVFAVDMFVGVLACGIVKYLGDNWFEFCVVVCNIAEFAVQLAPSRAFEFRGVGSLSGLRVLRLIRLFEGLEIAGLSMISTGVQV
jgi:hypothetical protein